MPAPISNPEPWLEVPEPASRPGRKGQAHLIKLDPPLRRAIIIAAIAITGFALHASSSVVVPVLLALCLVLAVQPLVDLLERRGWPTFASVTVGMFTLVAGLGLFVAALLVGLNRLLAELPRYEAEARELQTQATVWFASQGMLQAATSINATQPGRLLVEWCLSLVQDIPELAGASLFVFILTLFMLIERNAFRKKLSKRASEFARSNARVMRDVQHYLGIKTLVSMITGVLATGWCLVWGVQNALLWGVLAFVLNYIPVAGSIAAAIPPIAITLLTGDVSQLVAVTLGYIAINTAVGGILEPRWLGRACGLSPLVALMSIVIWGALLGPAGALLSVPLTSALRLGLARFRDFSWLSQLMTEDRPSLEVPLTGPEAISPTTRDSIQRPTTVQS